MEELHEKENTNTNIQPKDGQRDFLCSNNLVNRCPSLDFINPNDVSEEAALDYLASILAKALIHKKKNEINQRNQFK